MQQIFDFLDGKKTIIGASIVFLGGGAYALKWIDETTFKQIESVGIAISVFGLGHKLQKMTK